MGNTESFEGLPRRTAAPQKTTCESGLMLHIWRKASLTNGLPLLWEQRCNLHKHKIDGALFPAPGVVLYLL